MKRAHADGLLEIALNLSRYLSSESRRLDPNPSGHVVVPRDAPAIPPDSPEDEGTPALVADAEYSIKDAVKITRKAEVTLRKMVTSGRLPGRKEGRRIVLLGKDLAKIMAGSIPVIPTLSPDDVPDA